MNTKKMNLLLGLIMMITLEATAQSQLNAPITPAATPTYTSAPNPNYINPAVAPDPVVQQTTAPGSPVTNPAPATLTQPVTLTITQPDAAPPRNR